MKKINIESLSGQALFVGTDVHKKTFHVTLRTLDCELSSQSITASWSALKKLLNPFKALPIKPSMKRVISVFGFIVIYASGEFAVVSLHRV